ncbi:MAG: thioredoxin family protein [Candidatus Aminicenantales bacterium]
MEIKVLGTGCPKCKELEKRTVNALAELGLTADVEKVTDIRKIMEYGILTTPGLVINGRVVSSGRIPRPEEIKAWIQEGADNA